MTASDVDKYNIPDVIEIIIFNTSSRVLSRFIPENLDIWNNGLFSATKNRVGRDCQQRYYSKYTVNPSANNC